MRRITDPVPDGLGISQRSVTVSTVGLVPAIRRLTAEGLQVRLAVSLHAPDDELRDELVPVNRRWKVAEVLEAAWEYAAATGRRVSIEYALIKDINDQPWRADLLAGLLAGRLAHVNLIPLNPTPGLAVDGVRAGFHAGVRRTGWRPAGSRSPCATPGAARSTGPAASSPRPRWYPSHGHLNQGQYSPGRLRRCRSAPGYRSRPCRARTLSPGVAARWPGGWCTGPGARRSRPARSPRTDPGGPPVRRVRPRVDHGVPARVALRRGVDRGRRRHADRGRGHPDRGHGPGPPAGRLRRCSGSGTAA